MKVFLLTLVLVLIAVILMGIKVLFFKNAKFPETQIGHNKVLRKRKIYCPKTLDAIERKKCGSCSAE